MEEFRKIFLQVQKGNVKTYIRMCLNPGQSLNIWNITESIKLTFNMDRAPIYMTEGGVELELDDVVDYITQFIGNPSFTLHIKNNFTKNTEGCQQLQQELDPTSKILIDNLLNNLETNKDLESFLCTQCPSTMQFYSNSRFLTTADRNNISKHIIKQLLCIDPNRMLQRSDFEKLAGFIVDIFPGEQPDTYYRKYSNGKIASGKLYDAYTNQRKKLAKSGLITRRTRKRKNE